MTLSLPYPPPFLESHLATPSLWKPPYLRSPVSRIRARDTVLMNALLRIGVPCCLGTYACLQYFDPHQRGSHSAAMRQDLQGTFLLLFLFASPHHTTPHARPDSREEVSIPFHAVPYRLSLHMWPRLRCYTTEGWETLVDAEARRPEQANRPGPPVRRDPHGRRGSVDAATSGGQSALGADQEDYGGRAFLERRPEGRPSGERLRGGEAGVEESPGRWARRAFSEEISRLMDRRS